MLSVPQSVFMKRLPVLALAAFAGTAAADGGSTTGVVEPAIVFIEADPSDSAKFEEYQDVPEGLVLPHFNLEWNANQELFQGGMFLELDAIDVSQEDQRIALGFGSRGLWKGKLDYKENPHRFGDGMKQLYTYQGDGVFTLPDTLQSALQAAPASADTNADLQWDAGTKGAIMRDALADAAGINVGYRRKTGSVGFEFTPTKDWRFGFDAQREKRNGTRPQGVGQIFNLSPAELAVPVDYTTDDLKIFVEYKRKHWFLGANYLWSNFSNDEQSVTWDYQLALNDTPVNATSAIPGRSRMALAPDNTMGAWQAYFGAFLPGHTSVNATASRSTTRQNDDFLPFTTNSLLVSPALPATGADAEYVNSLADLRVTSRPLPWFRVKAWWRDYEQDNNTPMLDFDKYVETDYTTGTPARANLPFAYEKTNYGALVGFGPADWVDIGLSWEREDMSRRFASVRSSDEDTWKLTADFDVTERLFVRATYKTQDRSAGHYDAEYHEESFPAGEPNRYPVNEGERRFYETDREKQSYSLMAEFAPNEIIAIIAQVDHSNSDYFDPNTGLHVGKTYDSMEDRNGDTVPEAIPILLAGRTKNDEDDYTLGFHITPNENWEIGIEHTWESADWSMASRYRNVTAGAGTDNPLDDWSSDFKDRYRTLSIDFRGLWDEDRWEIRGQLDMTQGTGRIHTDVVAGGAASGDTLLTDFPKLESDFTSARLALERHLASGWDVGFQYWYERWTSDDWQSDYNQPYMGNPTQDPSASTWIQLGNDFRDYENHILMVLARYHF